MTNFDTTRYALALHTSSPQLGLSINNFVGESRTQTWDLDRELSTYLHQYLFEFLAPQTWQDLAFLAVAKGPGSFTSTRIGMVVARTLAQQLEIPLFAISTLAAFARSQPNNEDGESAIAIQMPATRGQLYVGVYQPTPSTAAISTLVPDTVMTPEAWQITLEKLEIAYKFIETPNYLGNNADSLLALAKEAWDLGKLPSWQEALPFYGF
jgi:tRNA threonylcarbamoyl adenosine modification protein YeaZ